MFPPDESLLRARHRERLAEAERERIVSLVRRCRRARRLQRRAERLQRRADRARADLRRPCPE